MLGICSPIGQFAFPVMRVAARILAQKYLVYRWTKNPYVNGHTKFGKLRLVENDRLWWVIVDDELKYDAIALSQFSLYVLYGFGLNDYFLSFGSRSMRLSR